MTDEWLLHQLLSRADKRLFSLSCPAAPRDAIFPHLEKPISGSALVSVDDTEQGKDMRGNLVKTYQSIWKCESCSGEYETRENLFTVSNRSADLTPLSLS